ncbi:unnamed protein product [Rhizophagus irregularis]|nr:unnamed protein product [Rhizophagus irregularis]
MDKKRTKTGRILVFEYTITNKMNSFLPMFFLKLQLFIYCFLPTYICIVYSIFDVSGNGQLENWEMTYSSK